jgi:hypothetical protein
MLTRVFFHEIQKLLRVPKRIKQKSVLIKISFPYPYTENNKIDNLRVRSKQKKKLL